MRNKKILCLLAAWSLALTAPGSVTGAAAAEGGTGSMNTFTDEIAGTGNDISADGYTETGNDTSADGYAETSNDTSADGYAETGNDTSDIEYVGVARDASGDGVQTDTATGYSYQIYQEWDEEKQWAEITSYAGQDAALVIPATLGGYPVGRIGNYAFKGNENITSLVISEGIYDLGIEAFMNCTNLVSLSLPGTITSCYNRIFSGCTSLKEIELKEGMTMIGWRQFEGCTSLETVTFPSTIKIWSTMHPSSGIAQTPHDCNVLNGCTALKKVVFTPGLKTLYDFAGVRDCPNITELDIPASVESIDYAFGMCDNLEKITLHEGLKTVGLSAFDGCTALKEIQLPNSVTEIKNRAFYNCESLTSLVLPPLAKDLGISITSGCTSLKEIYLLANAVASYQELELGDGGTLYCMEKSRAYNMYLSGMKEAGKESQLATIADAGAKAEPYQGTYDGTAHQAVQMQGVQSGDQVLYRIQDGIFQEEIPTLTEPGVHVVEVIVNRMNQGKIAAHSCLTVRARINKRQYEMTLSDTTVTAGQDYTISPQGYQGSGEPTFSFYTDEACQYACDGKPQTAGVYYVQAEVPENTYDAPVQSNVAKLTIQEPQQTTSTLDPGASSTANPSDTTTNPGDSTTTPGSSSQPSTSADPAPGTSTSPAPGTSASPAPGTSTSPGTGTSASPAPGTSATPGSGTSTSPGPAPSVKPSPTPATPHSPSPNGTGQKVSVKKVTLKGVTSPAKKKITLRWNKVKNATGYQVQTALNKKFTKGKKTSTVKKNSTKKTVGKLKSRKKYYVRVRAYRSLNGKKYYGAWSKVKKVKVK